MVKEINIVSVEVGDIERLQALGQETFRETFAEKNTAENMQKYLEEGFNIKQLAAELSNPDTAFYFALLEGKEIGYLKLNFGKAQTELQDPLAVEIERIYVLNEFHGKRVGQILYEKAITIAKERKAAYIWLGVWEENARALSFYKKNGFVEFDKHIFKLGNEEQTDLMMKLDLS